MKKFLTLRKLSQFLLVALITFLGIRHQVVGGGPEGAAPLDSYCAFGALETAVYFARTGQFLAKTNYSNFIIFGALAVVTVLTGAAFCSWICPLGTIQEWLAGLTKRVFGRQFAIPVSIHRPLRYLRYVVLGLIIYLTVISYKLIFEAYDPFKVLFHFKFEETAAFVVFGGIIVASLLVERFWCKYLCPLGAVISILGKFNLVKIRRDSKECIDCGLCTRHCAMDIDVAKAAAVPERDCVKCLDCIDACPKHGALTLGIGGGK